VAYVDPCQQTEAGGLCL